MEHYHTHSDLLDSIKDRIKDGEYKMLMESLSAIKDIKKEIYVKVIRIKSQTTIYTETLKDDDEQCESYIHNIGDNFRYELCSNNCECGECSRQPLKIVEVKNELKQETMWMKVCDDREYLTGSECLGRHIFEMLKKNKTMNMGTGDILVYLEDNE